MVYPVTDLSYLLGEWSIERTFRNDAGVTFATFTGTLDMTLVGQRQPSPDSMPTMLYQERGTFRQGQLTTATYRDLRYQTVGAGQADVTFELDGAAGGLFHHVDLRTGAWTVEHPCAEDLYRGRYEIVDDLTWRQQWDVAGPEKDYSIRSRFSRTGRPDPQ